MFQKNQISIDINSIKWMKGFKGILFTPYLDFNSRNQLTNSHNRLHFQKRLQCFSLHFLIKLNFTHYGVTKALMCNNVNLVRNLVTTARIAALVCRLN